MNLFGEELTKKRETPAPGGYAARPGTGPGGETCRTCRHRCRIVYDRSYNKCGLQRENWTHGPGTDIRVGSPACRFWEGGEPEVFLM